MSDATWVQEPDPVLHALQRQLAETLGPGFGVACTDVDGDPQALFPEESATIRQAVPRRQREFAAGRRAARQAMARIGRPPLAIPSAADRSPIWPEGLSGSLSHTDKACVAVVTGQPGCFIGIDLENDLPVEQDLWDTICTPHERDWLAKQAEELQGIWVTRLFCAKEAFYKWQYPQTGLMLEFLDVQVDLNPHATGFGVRPAAGKSTHLPVGHATGQLLRGGGLVLAWVVGMPTYQEPPHP